MKSHLRQLISAVKERQPLWDRNHEMRHERVLIEALWNEVSILLGLPHHIVKTKWKTLKDTYRKEAKRVSNETSYKPTWPYYNALYFLYPQLKLDTQSTDNLDNGNTNSGAEEAKIEFVYENVDMNHDEESESSTSKGVKRKFDDDTFESSVNDQHSKNTDNYFEDEDMCFFKSLVPHVKQLSAQKKMLMRMRIQEIVYKEVYSSDLD